MPVEDRHHKHALDLLKHALRNKWAFFLLEPTGSMLVQYDSRGGFICFFFGYIRSSGDAQYLDAAGLALDMVGAQFSRDELEGQVHIYVNPDASS